MKRFYLILSLITITFLITGAKGCGIKKSSTTDGGVFKSTDFGENWRQKIFVGKDGKKVITIGNVNVRSMVFDPKDDNIIYLLTEGKGIYKTTNKGNQWQPTTLSSGTYLDLSIDTLNTKVIYTTQGTKILKTVNGMESWNEIYIETRPKQKLVSVIVNPFSSNIVYAATTTSIIKSTDYGNSWELLDWTTPSIDSLHISKKNSNVLYARTNQGVYKSTNGGIDWQSVNEGLKQFKGGLKIYWFNFDPETEYIFLGTAYGIIKSLDGGQTWESIPTLFDFKKIPIKTVIYHPNNLNKIIFSVNNVLHKTEDGGHTWKTLKTVKTSRIINYMTNDPTTGDTIYLGTYKPAKK